MRKLFRHETAAPGLSASTHENGQRSQPSSNESARPIVSKQSAIHRIRYMIKATPVHATRGIAISKPVTTDMFRANIVIAERLLHTIDAQKLNAEYHWSSLRIGRDQVYFDALKSSRRSQSGRNDQTTGTDRTKSLALVRVRQANGKTLLGTYVVVPTEDVDSCESEKLSRKTIAVGDVVLTSS
jgi:hypothetical protein